MNMMRGEMEFKKMKMEVIDTKIQHLKFKKLIVTAKEKINELETQ